jgi:hyaluronoglucosaminidase
MRRFMVVLAVVGSMIGAPASFAAETTSSVAAEPPPAGADLAVPAVVPTPQEVTPRGGSIEVPDVVRVAAGDEVDDATLDTIDDALRAAGVETVRHVDPGDRLTGPLTVTVGQPAVTAEVADRLADLQVAGPDGLPAEGYVLATGRHDSVGQVVLAGVDSDGTYYAAKTLAQLFVPHEDTHRLPAVKIRDWPAMTLRGTIEGFYGTPWSHEQRLRQMDFYGDMKMNVYAYAPKDDPYHRDRWADPYPPADLERIGELVDRGLANHVDFIFAISPGLSICYSSDAHIDALVAKFDAVYDLGVRQFNVALDDINYTDWHCAEDPARFGTGAAGAGAAQSYLLNEVVERFAERRPDVQRIQMVPTEYYNVAESPYKKALREQMDPSVIVEWTGVGVVPAAITTDQAAAASAVFGHDIFVWDNYPVNDYAAGQLLLGPFNGREAGLSGELYGLHANPMNQAEASTIPLVTVADFVWNDAAYDSQRSLAAALDYVAGGDPELAAALGWFVDVNYASILNPTNAPTLRPLIDAFRAEYDAGGTGAAAAALRAALADVEAAPELIRDRIDNPLFLDETAVWLDATQLWARAADAAVRMLQAQAEGDGSAAWVARREAVAAADAARALRDDTVPHRSSAPKVGTGVIDTFVTEALADNDAWLGVVAEGLTGTTSMTTYQSYTVANMVDGDLSTFYWSAERAAAGDHVGVDLGEVEEITSVEIAMAKPTSPRDYIQAGVLEYSDDGSAWTALGTFTGQPEISVGVPDGTAARYVRLRATAGQNEWVVVREFDVEVVGGITRTVSGGPPAAAGSTLAAAADGRPETAAVAARAPEPGESLAVTYSVARPLSGVVVLQDPDRPADGTVQIRVDGQWQPIGALSGGYTELIADGQAVDGIRIAWAAGTTAPSTSEIIGWFAEEPTVTLSPDSLAVESGGEASTAAATIEARSLAPLSGTLTISVPDGWTADPVQRDVTIGRGQSVQVPIEVSAPDTATPTGELTASVVVDDVRATATIPVRLVPPVADVNLALDGTATASSVEQDLPQFAPEFAVDGDATTRWSSAHTDDEWLQVELAEPTRVGKAVLMWERACATGYDLLGSVDGTTWQPLASVTDTTCATDEVRFDSVEPIRFVRMQGHSRATQYGYSLYELELYGVR